MNNPFEAQPGKFVFLTFYKMVGSNIEAAVFDKIHMDGQSNGNTGCVLEVVSTNPYVLKEVSRETYIEAEAKVIKMRKAAAEWKKLTGGM